MKIVQISPKYSLPHEIGVNAYTIFPEIFKKIGGKHNFLKFTLVIGSKRIDDYFAVVRFLHGAQKLYDISMLFSAVQRLYGSDYKDAFNYICNSENLTSLENKSKQQIKKHLKNLSEKYTDQFGMARQIQKFYKQHLEDDEKKLLLKNIPCPAKYKPSSPKDTNLLLKLRIELLLLARNNHSHNATNAVLSPDGKKIVCWDIEDNGKIHKFLITLTFQQLYKLTRKAMARFWINEYTNNVKQKNMKEVEKTMQQVLRRSRELIKSKSPNQGRA